MVTGSENANRPWSGLTTTLTLCLWEHSAVGASLLNRYKVNLTGKETSAVSQRQFCKLSGCGISGMFAQEETADVNFALFVSQGQSYPRLWPARPRRGKQGFRRERLKSRSAGHPRALPFVIFLARWIQCSVIPPDFLRATGHTSARKVVWALTGLALLRNLITLARENEEESSGLGQET